MNRVNEDSKFVKGISIPYVQSALIFVLLMISLGYLKGSSKDVALYWDMGLLFQMIFILFNILVGFQVRNYKNYWKHSVAAYVALMVLGIFIIAMFSGQSIGDAGLTRKMYNLFTLVFGILQVMMGLARWVVKYAEEETWTKPRQKNR